MRALVVWVFPCFAANLGAGEVCGQAYPNSFPNRPLRFVTTGIGASTDLAARTVAQGLTDNAGWTVIVDNRGSTIIAADAVARASPDGYTLLVATEALWRGPLFQKMPFDAIKDFSPIALASRAPNLLVVHPSLPVKSVKELIALAKARPGELNYGAGAIGAATHMASELFRVRAGIDIVHIPYKSSGQAATAIISGQLQLMFATTGAASVHVKSGRVRALAISTLEPSVLAPGLPTVAAAGNLPGFESAATAGVFAPAGAPEGLVNRLNEEIRRALNRPDTKERFFNQGVEVVSTTPEQAGTFVKSDTATTAKLIRDAGIRTER